jgi:adenine-specific DNA methylase
MYENNFFFFFFFFFFGNRKTGTGQFGGKNQYVLCRIKSDSRLPFPFYSNTDVLIFNDDSNRAGKNMPEVNKAYLDPLYNQHPYNSNYFVPNLLVDCQLSNLKGLSSWLEPLTSAYSTRFCFSPSQWLPRQMQQCM